VPCVRVGRVRKYFYLYMCACVENMRFTVVAPVQIFCLRIHVRFSREYRWKCFCFVLGARWRQCLNCTDAKGGESEISLLQSLVTF
jgi:hypothetical protein